MKYFECEVCGDRFDTDLEQCPVCGGEVVQIQAREQDSRDRENWMYERLAVAYSEIASKNEELSASRRSSAGFQMMSMRENCKDKLISFRTSKGCEGKDENPTIQNDNT